MIIHSGRVYTASGCKDVCLKVEGEKITEILEDYQGPIDLEFGNHRIIPGIIDTHNHGSMGYSLMGVVDDMEQQVRGYLKGVASTGVTSVFPSCDTQYFKTVVKVAKSEYEGARIVGIHSEGPYLNRVGEKGIDLGHPEINLEDIQKWIEECEGMLKLFGLAPELAGAKEAVELLTKHGVRVAFTHSNCNYEQALEAFDWGISVTTHTANVMSGIHHRNMGGLGACLLRDDVYNELICDGLHVMNPMIDIMMRIKKDPYDHFMMISDNVAIAGVPVGRYCMSRKRGDMVVNVDEQGYCLTDTGRLCGSSKPVIYGVKNLVENLNIPLETVVKMCSLNPAKVYNLEGKGELKVGNYADFVVIDDAYNVLHTYSLGKEIYHHLIDTHLTNDKFIEEHRM